MTHSLHCSMSRRDLLFFFPPVLLAFLLLFTGCRSKDKQAADGNAAAYYFDYRVNAEEGKDNLTILFQFRDERNGDALAIHPAGMVTLDGEKLSPDSSRLAGIFYELHKPIDSFAGVHQVIFTGADKKMYKETFRFQPFQLETALPDTIRRSELRLQLTGLDSAESIRVLMTDTSFINNGINRVDSVYNGRLLIEPEALEELANGPVQLELVREYARPLRQPPLKGGRLLITYSLKREFILQD